jgi:hypothetical protein
MCCVADMATATVSLPAAMATDSAATVRVEVREAAELVWAETDSVAWELSLKNRFYCSGLP